MRSLSLLIAACIASFTIAFAPASSRRTALRFQPLKESFGFSFAEDAQGTFSLDDKTKAIVGENNYKKFIESYDPNGLLIREFDIIKSVREQKLLTLTATSGLLEALEEKGLTLSQVEKLLPLADEFNLLPLAVQNKGLVLALAPLVIGSADLAIPLVVSLLKSPPALFLLPGLALVLLGGKEIVGGNSFGGVLEGLLGVPLVALGSLLGGKVDVPTITPSSTAKIVIASTPSVKASPAPRVSAPLAKKSTAAPKITVSAPKASASKAVKVASIAAAPANFAPRKPVRKLVKVKVGKPL